MGRKFDPRNCDSFATDGVGAEISMSAGYRDDRAQDEMLAGVAKSILRGRQARSLFISSHLFGDPAWDMLLALFAYAALGQKVGLLELSGVAKVSVESGKRWAEALASEDLVTIDDSAPDSKGRSIELTEGGRAAMRQVLRCLLDD